VNFGLCFLSDPFPPIQPHPLQAKKIIQSSETEARNNLAVNYDERTSFSICAASLTPIPRGNPLVRSPFSGATYKPEFVNTVCVIDGMAKVGLETIGLVNFLQLKGGK
jgi:coatomer protein complex subunit alpha (xenin)